MRGFGVVSFQMLLGRTIYVLILSPGLEQQKKRSGAPQGPIQGAPRCSKRLETGKNDQNLSIFINFLPFFTKRGLVICLASLISAAELDKMAEDP